MSVRDKHPLAGKTVKLIVDNKKFESLDGADFRIEDWWQNVAGQSWMVCRGNPACVTYAVRSGTSGLPMNDEVVYGKIGSMGYLVHQTEIVQPTGTAETA